MLIYMYSPFTQEYVGCKEADANPEATRLQKKFVPLLPANATFVAPPQYGENEIPVYENGEWVVKADYRHGFMCVNDDWAVLPIDKIGMPDGYPTAKDVAQLVEKDRDRFKIEDHKVVYKSDEEYQLCLQQKEAERVAQLWHPAVDIERAIYKARGLDFNDLIELAQKSEQDIDVKLFKINLKAKDFQRSDEVVSTIGSLLAIDDKRLTAFFETGELKDD